MRILSLTRNEVIRLFHSRILILFMLLTILSMPFRVSPAYGVMFTSIMSTNTASNTILAPVCTAALTGAFLFAIFTVFELDKVCRNHIEDIVVPSVGIMPLLFSKVFSFIALAFCNVLFAAVIWLPYSLSRLTFLFDIKIYLFSFFMILLPAILFSIFFSAGLYMLTHSMVISVIIYTAIFYAGIFMSSYSYLAPWVTTDVNVYSSCFGNSWVYKTVSYNRLLWLSISLSVFFVGVLCTRRYGKKIVSSILINSRKFHRPVIAVFLIAASFLLYTGEPYCDNSDDFVPQNRLYQMNTKVILTKIKPAITLDTKHNFLNGTAEYKLLNNSKTAQKVMMHLHSGYMIKRITANGKNIACKKLFTSTNSTYYRIAIPMQVHINLLISYSGRIKIWNSQQFIIPLSEISHDYVCLVGDSVYPDIEAKRACKCLGTVTLPSNLYVCGTGLIQLINNDFDNGISTWSFYTGSPQINAGNYQFKRMYTSGIFIHFYYSGKQTGNIEKTGIENVIKDAVNYYSKNIGRLFINRITVLENSATCQGGWMLYGLSCFGEDTLDPNGFAGIKNDGTGSANEGTSGAEILTHELGHQWWGMLCEFGGKSWTQEGLTVYMSYKFLQHEYGESYVKTHFEDVWQNNVNALRRSYYYRNPKALIALRKINKTSAESISSTIDNRLQYNAVPLKLLKAEKLIGTKRFMKVISRLYNDSVNKGTVITYNLFVKECGLHRKDLAIPGIVDD